MSAIQASLVKEVSHALDQSTQKAANLEDDLELQEFISYFRKKFGDQVIAVIFFGSCLSTITKKETSFRDFFVILDSYKTTGSILTRAFHHILPPDLYHLELTMPHGGSAECKYYLLSLDHLIRATSPHAKDLYVMGRLSKQVACVYAKNESAKLLVARCLASAADTVVRQACFGHGLLPDALY